MFLKSLRVLLILISLSATAGILSSESWATAQKPATAPASGAPAPVATVSPAPTPTPAVTPTTNDEKGVLDLVAIKEQIKRCTALQELSVRLICYDNLALDLGYMTASRMKADAAKIGKVGFWQISTQDNPDGIKQTYLRVDSSNLIESRSGTERLVSLVIRCTPGKTDAFLDWKAPVADGWRGKNASKSFVTYYTNSDDSITGDWEISTDRQALFSLDPTAFVRSILNKKRLTLKFVAEGTSVQTVQFNITGIETAIDTIVKSCY